MKILIKSKILTFLIIISCSQLHAEEILESKLYLTDAMIESSKGNMQQLFDAWIAPNTYGNGFIAHESTKERLITEDLIKQGVKRFCDANDSVLKIDWHNGGIYSCQRNDGSSIGKISTRILENNLLEVGCKSSESLNRMANFEKLVNEIPLKNGPSGWVETDEGTIAFVRIGNLDKRDLIGIEGSNSFLDFVPIEDIKKIVFSKSCCDITATFKDDRTATYNASNLVQIYKVDRAPNSNISPYVTSHYGLNGLPFVIVDESSGQPYTKSFPNFKGIKSIVIDQNTSAKVNLPGGKIQSSFKADADSRVNQFSQKLSDEANQLYEEGRRNGWIKLLPDGSKLTPKLLKHLQLELVNIISSPACNNSNSGFTDTQAILKCNLARREFKLVAVEGYSLVTNVTPLSAIIVLNKLKRDSK